MLRQKTVITYPQEIVQDAPKFKFTRGSIKGTIGKRLE